MPTIQLRTADDAYALSRLDYGAVDTGTTSISIGVCIWNDRPVSVTGELLGTGDGSRTSFATAYKPIVNHASATIAVKADGVPASGYTIDHSNGLIVFSSPPASGVVVTCDYSYSVGSSDASAVVLVLEQVFATAGDGATKAFSLPTRCLTPLKLLVAGVEIPSTDYALQNSGDTLYCNAAPAANAAVLLYYVDALCQGGYYEVRSSGVINPYGQSGFTDDAESAYAKLGGVFTRTSVLVGTGNGSTTVYDTGTPMIRTVSTVTVGGSAVTDYALNNVTGRITFATAPANNAEVRMTYTYERAHQIGNIRQWAARKVYPRVSLPYDAANTTLTAKIRVVAQ